MSWSLVHLVVSGQRWCNWQPTAHPDRRSGHYPEMGRLVADAGKRDWDELTAEYGAMLMDGLSVVGTRGKHVNVLHHLMGYLKNHLSNEDKAYLWSVGSFWASSRTTGRGLCR